MMDFAKKLRHYRISESEYKLICDLLKREPAPIEWALFSALWSEHCSYKSSRVHLKKFGRTLNETVVNAHGENAGVIDLGHSERIAFKMESHNHPSFIEPYQGAATGVGGILRDIFTMGARPIAIADYLCFGETTADRMSTLMDGVVRGISGYGNCVGVPTVTGQTNFHSSYNKNILVNAMAVGLLRPQDKIALSKAKGPGNLVVYVGAKTGKDGVHGAAMASESFDDNSEAKKPNVQIGDPYFEKLLIESCLQVIQDDLVVAIQDMGAAGLTSSSFEMASKGQVGMEMRLDEVPLRDSTMTPEEILLSESQERMLLVCLPEKLSQIQAHFAKWGLDAVVIGKIIPERKVKLYWHGECLTDIDPDLLVENAPMYQRSFKPWSNPRKAERIDLGTSAQSLKTWLEKSFSSALKGSRKPIYRQYDQRVGAMTARGADYDVAFQKLPDSGRGLATVVGCRPHVIRVDARLGGYDAIFYPSLQMAIKGAEAKALTDCLNFGNPEKENIMSEFVACVDAIADGAIHLKAPVISGNVSFYNETMGQNITSTPATGMVGLRDSVENIPEDRFQEEGLSVFWIRSKGPEITGVVGEELQTAPAFTGEFDVESQTRFVQAMLQLGNHPAVQVSQVVGGGGVLFTLAQMCLDGVGFESLPTLSSLSADQWVRERMYEVVLATRDPEVLRKKLSEMASGLDLEVLEIGRSGGKVFKMSPEFEVSVPDLKSKSRDAMKTYFSGVGP